MEFLQVYNKRVDFTRYAFYERYRWLTRKDLKIFLASKNASGYDLDWAIE